MDETEGQGTKETLVTSAWALGFLGLFGREDGKTASGVVGFVCFFGGSALAWGWGLLFFFGECKKERNGIKQTPME